MKTGSENNNWRGGRSIASNGYVIVRVGVGHHLADVRGYAYEHRIVAERKLGRRLKQGEQVHHINGQKHDNRPENLLVTESVAHHRQEHRKQDSKLKRVGQTNQTIQCACGCGNMLSTFDTAGRPRTYINGHNPQDTSIQTLFITACGIGRRLQEVAAITGQSLQAAKCMASKLVSSNKLTRKGRGIYGS